MLFSLFFPRVTIPHRKIARNGSLLDGGAKNITYRSHGLGVPRIVFPDTFWRLITLAL